MRKFLAAFITINLLFLLLILVNMIPKEYIEKNLKASVAYYNLHESRYNRVKNLDQSKEDVIADAILLNIIWNTEKESIIKSTLLSKYYYRNLIGDSYSRNLKDTVFNNQDANMEYARYWHGSIILYKTLLLLLDINGIKMVNFIMHTLLLIMLLIKLCSCNMKELFIAYIIGYLSTFMFFGHLSLEYSSALTISTIGCLFLLNNKIKQEELFLLLGIFVAFFDFLTIETLTLSMPLLFYVMKADKNGERIKFKKLIKFSFLWLMGYVATFLYKWVLTTILCKENFITGSAALGADRMYETYSKLRAGIKMNVWMLLPGINNSNKAFILFIAILILYSIALFILRKNDLSKSKIASIISISIIPYLRYFVLSNHSFGHYFFTYRAQFSTVVALIALLMIGIDRSLFTKEGKNVLNNTNAMFKRK